MTNTGDTPFDFAIALHTYLRTNDVLKAQLEGLQGVKFEDNTTGQWQEQWGDITQVVGEIDRLYHDAAGSLTLRELGRKVSITHADFTDVVVWNPGPEKAAQLSDMPAEDWQRMLCVEAARVIDPVTPAARRGVGRHADLHRGLTLNIPVPTRPNRRRTRSRRPGAKRAWPCRTEQ